MKNEIHSPVVTEAGTSLPPILGVQVPVRCDVLEPTMTFFVQRLGFRIDAIFPADEPHTAMLSGHGISLRLGPNVRGNCDQLYLLCNDPARFGDDRDFVAPNGLRIRVTDADPDMHVPETVQALHVSRGGSDTRWTVGRAGLRYRDLLPERHGGAFIASHIRILEGGPVPDYVHYHKVRFQMIFCRKGWVRVVYEGQGEPFVLNAGDCVLQPPQIRHRVLESSRGAEVIELGSPAEHITMVDHLMSLPTPERYPGDFDFHGQRFVRHVAAIAEWRPWRQAGFESADTGIGAATDGLAGVRVVRRATQSEACDAMRHDAEFCFFFVLTGSVVVRHDGVMHTLHADDSITLPGNEAYAFESMSNDLLLLEVTLPDSV